MTLLKDAILSNLEAVGYLIDGFPRELSQGKIFTQQVEPDCTLEWNMSYTVHDI